MVQPRSRPGSNRAVRLGPLAAAPSNVSPSPEDSAAPAELMTRPARAPPSSAFVLDAAAEYDVPAGSSMVPTPTLPSLSASTVASRMTTSRPGTSPDVGTTLNSGMPHFDYPTTAWRGGGTPAERSRSPPPESYSEAGSARLVPLGKWRAPDAADYSLLDADHAHAREPRRKDRRSAASRTSTPNGLRGPVTLPSKSASQPTLAHAPMSMGANHLHTSLAVYEPGAPFLDDLKQLRKKVRKLEGAYQSAHTDHAKVMHEYAAARHEWETAKLQSERAAQARVAQITSEWEQRLTTSEAAAARTLEERVKKELDRQVIELTGTAAERAQLQFEREREARIESMRGRCIRRLLQARLTKGWSAWSEHFEAYTYAHQRLRTCANRLRAPGKATAFGLWRGQWREELAARRAAEEAAAIEGNLRLEVARLKSELEGTRLEQQRRVAQGESHKANALAHLRVELTGSAEEQAAAYEQKVKHERVELLRRQITRRMANRDLNNGWAAWMQLWSARAYALDKLRDVGNKLRAPEVDASFRVWTRSLAVAQKAAQKEEWLKKEREKAVLEARLEQTRAGVSDQVLLMDEERAKALEAQLEKLQGDEAARAALIAEAQKEERIELLRRQIVRRMLHDGKRKAWTTWASVGIAAARQRRETEMSAANVAAGSLTEQLAAAHAELVEVRAMMEKQEARLSDEKRAAVERLRAELTGTAEEREEAMREADQEARIELARRQFARRMLYRGVSTGWNAWREFAFAKRDALLRLRHCANSLRTPQQAVGFAALRSYRERSLRRAAARSHEAKRMQLEADNAAISKELRIAREDSVAALKTLSDERLALLEQVAMLSGGTAEVEALLAAQQGQARQERIELFTRQSIRRMLSQDVAQAWSSWCDYSTATGFAKRQMSYAVSRMNKPQVESAFTGWARVAGNERVAASQTVQMKREAELQLKLERAEREFNRVLAEKDAKMEAAIERRVVELTGSYSEQLAINEAHAKEERIEMKRRQSVRRLVNRDLAYGWTAWLELWSAKVYAIGKLQDVSNRLRAPDMAVAFGGWVADMHEEARVAERIKLEDESRSLEAQLRSSRFDVSKLTMVRTANEDEIADLKKRLKERAEMHEAAAASLEGYRNLPYEIEELKAMCETLREAAAAADRKREEAEGDVARQHAESNNLLERLLAQQRRAFEDDVKVLSSQLNSTSGHASHVEAELRDELTGCRKEVAQLQAQLNEKVRDFAAADAAARAALEAANGRAAAEAAQREAAEAKAKAAAEAGEAKAKAATEAAEAKARAAAEAAELKAMAAADELEKEMAAARAAAELEMERAAARAAADLEKERAAGRAAADAAAAAAATELEKERAAAASAAAAAASAAAAAAATSVKEDSPPKKESSRDQALNALMSNATRIIDMFREWDVNGDGIVNRAEFHRALPMLGIDAPKAEVDALFSEWDKDGSGELGYDELKAILKAPIRAARQKQIAGGGSAVPDVGKGSASKSLPTTPSPASRVGTSAKAVKNVGAAASGFKANAAKKGGSAK